MNYHGVSPPPLQFFDREKKNEVKISELNSDNEVTGMLKALLFGHDFLDEYVPYQKTILRA